MKHIIFLSYAGTDKDLATYISNCINEQIGESFSCQLVEDRKKGDTTFTENVIEYFRNCNIFIVLLTKASINNQFVNQELGYAKCLKELGQIQLLQHVVERITGDTAQGSIELNQKDISYDKFGRLISSGFIATNMMHIDLEINENKYNEEKCALKIITLLSEREPFLIPIATERQQKLIRFINEHEFNNKVLTDLINSKTNLESRLSLPPDQVSYDYALQIINIGHLFDKEFINSIEDYIIKCKELNVWKDLQMQWIISRCGLHSGNKDNYFKLLNNLSVLFKKMDKKLIEVKEKYKI